MTHCGKVASRSGSEAFDQAFGELAEDVDVGHFPAPFGLDGALGYAVEADPGLQVLAQADHVQKWLLHDEPAHRAAAVIGVEVAVDGDPARLGERDRLLDLAALEVALGELGYLASASRIRRLSVCSKR
jgi:hypothetical protein